MPKNKQGQGDLYDFPKVQEFIQRLENESDRAAVIVGAAYLDAALEEVITSFLVDDTKAVKPVVKFATFAAKSSLAYCLGLIAPLELKDLGTIGGIRNQFAHVFADLSLSDPRMADECAKLHLADAAQFTGPGDPTPRDRLVATIAGLALSLMSRARRAEHRPIWTINRGQDL